jgi:hypothetical protein
MSNSHVNPINRPTSVFEALEQRRLLSASSAAAEAAALESMKEFGIENGADLLSSARADLIQQGESPDGAGEAVTAQRAFRVFNAMRGDLSGVDIDGAGLDDVMITYGSLFSVDANGNQMRDMASEHRVRVAANEAADSGRKWVINIEHWPTDVRRYGEAEVQETIDKFLQIIEWAKDERPEVEVGIYGMLPIRDYWTAVHYDLAVEQYENTDPSNSFHMEQAIKKLDRANEKMDVWQTANDLLKPLSEAVDFIAPSLYTFYEGQGGWEMYAEHNLAEAARYGKPVIPFLMPNYHDSVADGHLDLSAETWRQQLDFVHDRSDSVIIWRDFRNVSESDGWFQATAKFISELESEAVESQGESATGTVITPNPDEEEPVIEPSVFDAVVEEETEELIVSEQRRPEPLLKKESTAAEVKKQRAIEEARQTLVSFPSLRGVTSLAEFTKLRNAVQARSLQIVEAKPATRVEVSIGRELDELINVRRF